MDYSYRTFVRSGVSTKPGQVHPGVDVRYYIDPETEEPHIYRHGIAEPEVDDVLQRPMEDRPGREGSQVAVGRTQTGHLGVGWRRQ